MLMVGPTGCGKTYIVKTIAKLLNVPLAIADATTLTEAGYIGDDVESVLSNFWQPQIMMSKRQKRESYLSMRLIRSQRSRTATAVM